MKTLLLAILLLVSASVCLAQDRSLSPRRTIQHAPQLSVIADTDNAAGIAQSPYGFALPLGEPIPAGSTVGIYGRFLISSGASKALLWSDAGVMVVEASTWRYPFFGLEMATFRLPDGLRGDVWVTIAGRQASNTVKITVE